MSEAPTNTNTALAAGPTAEEKKMRAERDIQAGALIAFAGAGGMVPVTYEQLVIVAKTIAASGYFKDATNFAAVITKIQYGAELGIPIMAALNNIDIIEGRPSLRSALVAARIKASGHVRYKVAKWDNNECVIEWRRKYEDQWIDEGASSWNRDDSKTAGLLKDKSNHEKFFRAMAFARAITQGARAYCPDLFFGAVYDPDELREEVSEKALNEPPTPPESGADRLRAAVAKAKGDDEETPTRKRKGPSSGSPIVDVLESDEQREARVAKEAAKATPGKPTETPQVSPAVEPPVPTPSPSPIPSVSAPPATVEAPSVTPVASPPPSTPAPGPSTETAPNATTASSDGSSSTPTPADAEAKTPDPTPASTVGPEASTPATSTSTAAVEPPRPLPTTASSEFASSTPSSPPSTPTGGGDKLAVALASMPDDPKKHAGFFKEHRAGMSEAETSVLRSTIRAYGAVIKEDWTSFAALTDDDLDNAEAGAAMATKAGAAYGARIAEAIAKARFK